MLDFSGHLGFLFPCCCFMLLHDFRISLLLSVVSDLSLVTIVLDGSLFSCIGCQEKPLTTIKSKLNYCFSMFWRQQHKFDGMEAISKRLTCLGFLFSSFETCINTCTCSHKVSVRLVIQHLLSFMFRMEVLSRVVYTVFAGNCYTAHAGLSLICMLTLGLLKLFIL